MFSSGFFLFGVLYKRTLLFGVEVKSAVQTLKKGRFTLALLDSAESSPPAPAFEAPERREPPG
jgi:hypothetical protein